MHEPISPKNHRALMSLLQQLGNRRDAWQQAQSLMAPLLAPHFSPFDVYRSGEVDVSRHLALLLDPKGTHGQASLFWDAWVDHVIAAQNAQISNASTGSEPSNPVHGWLRRARVKRVETEHCTTTFPTRRFIDLCVHLQGQGGLLAIENKPWHESVDEPCQLYDYAVHLEKLAQGRPWVLVYVGQRAPDEKSISVDDRQRLSENGHFVTLTWGQLLRALAQCIPHIQAPKVRWFVEDFIKLMEQKTMAHRDSSELEHVAQLFGQNPQAVEQALLLRDSLLHWQSKQLEILREKILERADAAGLKPVWAVKMTDPNAYSYFSLPYPQWPGTSLRFEWHSGFGKEAVFSWGLHISGWDSSKFKVTDAKLSLPDLPQSEPAQREWPYWVYVLDDPLFAPEHEQDSSRSVHPWVSMHRSENDFVTLVWKRYEMLKSALSQLAAKHNGLPGFFSE